MTSAESTQARRLRRNGGSQEEIVVWLTRQSHVGLLGVRADAAIWIWHAGRLPDQHFAVRMFLPMLFDVVGVNFCFVFL